MELLLLLVILAVFLLPSFFMMRTQRKHQAERQATQSSLVVGDRVVNVAGLHGVIAGVGENEVEVEVAPGVVVVMDRIAIMRKVDSPDAPKVIESGPHEQNPTVHPEHLEQPEHSDHPENWPDPENPGAAR